MNKDHSTLTISYSPDMQHLYQQCEYAVTHATVASTYMNKDHSTLTIYHRWIQSYLSGWTQRVLLGANKSTTTWDL